jgi:hypothetical protein
MTFKWFARSCLSFYGFMLLLYAAPRPGIVTPALPNPILYLKGSQSYSGGNSPSCATLTFQQGCLSRRNVRAVARAASVRR